MTITEQGTSRSAAVRAQLSHPVIDADGHMVEFMPGVLDAVRDVGGPGIVDRLFAETPDPSSGLPPSGRRGFKTWMAMSEAERAATRTPKLTWWAFPTKNTRDRATAMLPRLLHERLDEFGIDYGVLYPSIAIMFTHIDDEDVRIAACRGLNDYHAAAFAEFADRLTPAALVPMHTPEEAVAELRHAVGLGLKAAAIPSYVTRPIESVAHAHPDLAGAVRWLDAYGIDSIHDYDSVWATCVELGVVPASHSPGFGPFFPTRCSTSNFVYNHMGHFASANEMLCKSLFLGGVTRRFPELRVAFLEGGVSWAARVFDDLIGRWEKRNLQGLENVDPARLDRDQFLTLMATYGGTMTEGRDREQILGSLSNPAEGAIARDDLDEFARCSIERAEDINAMFVPSFYFGCEADDSTTRFAFAPGNPFGARLNAIFSSDIGHWDVTDMTEVLHEAYEEVENGRLSDVDFRDFVFTNVARMYTSADPSFFDGTRVESAVRSLLDQP